MTDTGQAKKFPVTEDIKEAMALIKRGTDTLLVEEELEQKAGSFESNRQTSEN